MAKATQDEAQYHEGTPLRHCGICTMYRAPSSCTAVAGEISPYGVCERYYKARENPFRGGRLNISAARGAMNKGRYG